MRVLETGVTGRDDNSCGERGNRKGAERWVGVEFFGGEGSLRFRLVSSTFHNLPA